MNDYRLRYEGYLATFENYALKYMDSISTKPTVLADSMRYSLLSGGKRIRPVLALACADVLGVPSEEILPYALALEMIHTYSLIHDDLPAMDNDDFRRGKPTCHKAFGEANAILAGDGLLNELYAICLDQTLKGEKYAVAYDCRTGSRSLFLYASSRSIRGGFVIHSRTQDGEIAVGARCDRQHFKRQ